MSPCMAVSRYSMVLERKGYIEKATNGLNELRKTCTPNDGAIPLPCKEQKEMILENIDRAEALGIDGGFKCDLTYLRNQLQLWEENKCSKCSHSGYYRVY